MIISCGLFLIRKDNKILIAHPTMHPRSSWGIPKGKVEPGESLIEAAIRETYEESNIDVSGYKVLHDIPFVKYAKTNKILYSFALFEQENNFDFNQFNIKCNSNVPESKGGFPEMDDYMYVTVKEAHGLLHDTQIKCLDTISGLIEKIGGNKQPVYKTRY